MKHIIARFFESYKPVVKGVLFLLVLSSIGGAIIFIREKISEGVAQKNEVNVGYSTTSLVPVYVDQSHQAEPTVVSDTGGEVLGISSACGSYSPVQQVSAVDVSGGVNPACMLSDTATTDLTDGVGSDIYNLDPNMVYKVRKNSIVKVAKITWPKDAFEIRDQGAANDSHPIEVKENSNGSKSYYLKLGQGTENELVLGNFSNPFEAEQIETKIGGLPSENDPMSASVEVTTQDGAQNGTITVAGSGTNTAIPNYVNETVGDAILPPDGDANGRDYDIPSCSLSSLGNSKIIKLDEETSIAYLNKEVYQSQAVDKAASVAYWLSCLGNTGGDCEESYLFGIVVSSFSGNNSQCEEGKCAAQGAGVLYGAFNPMTGSAVEGYKDSNVEAGANDFTIKGEYYVTPCEVSIDGAIKPIWCFHFKNTATAQYAMQEMNTVPGDESFPEYDEFMDALSNYLKSSAGDSCAN